MQLKGLCDETSRPSQILIQHFHLANEEIEVQIRKKGLAQGHAQLVTEQYSHPSGCLIFLDQPTLQWQDLLPIVEWELMESSDLWSGCRIFPHHLIVPWPLYPYTALKLPGFSLWYFMCPLKIQFWRVLWRKLPDHFIISELNLWFQKCHDQRKIFLSFNSDTILLLMQCETSLALGGEGNCRIDCKESKSKGKISNRTNNF